MVANVINNFDFTILEFWHDIALETNNAITSLIKLISFLGQKGWFFIFLACFLIGFKKNRKTGFTILLSLFFGVLFTNVILKNLIARPRPYEHEMYFKWWMYVGGVLETGYSFPSGHVTATMATMMTLFLNTNKKYSWTLFFGVIAMGISRNYLMVHFPSDVIGGIAVGGLAAFSAQFVMDKLYNYKNDKINLKMTRTEIKN